MSVLAQLYQVYENSQSEIGKMQEGKVPLLDVYKRQSRSLPNSKRIRLQNAF